MWWNTQYCEMFGPFGCQKQTLAASYKQQFCSVVLSEDLLKLLLLRGGVEPNPGPKRKCKRTVEALRCSCGRYYGSEPCCPVNELASLCDKESRLHTDVNEPEVNTPLRAIVNPETKPYESSRSFLTSNVRNDVKETCCSNNADGEISQDDSIIRQQLDWDHNVGAFTLYSIETSLTVASVAPSSYKDVCSRLAIPFVACPLSTSWMQYRNLSIVKPRVLHHAPMDGDCLFSSLALAMGSTIATKSYLRTMICSFLPKCNIAPQFLENYIVGNSGQLQSERCVDVNDYLQKTNMKHDGVYGTCVELYTFAQLAHVDVYVYQCRCSSWVVYRFAGDRTNSTIMPLFIVHNLLGNHFDALSGISLLPNAAEHFSPNSTCGLKSAHNVPMVFSSTSSTSSAKKQPSVALHSNAVNDIPLFDEDERNHVSKDNESEQRDDEPRREMIIASDGSKKSRCDNFDWVFSCNSSSGKISVNEDASVSEDNSIQKNCFVEENLSVSKKDNSGISGDQVCGMCARMSTDRYPLRWSILKATDVKYRKFGKKIVQDCKVCQVCSEFNNLENIKSRDWKYSWPAVLYTLLTDHSLSDEVAFILYSIVPAAIRESWAKSKKMFHRAIRRSTKEPVMVDITDRKSKFNEKIKSFCAKDLEEALDSECYPDCRCPFGCFTFVEKCGYVSFNHLINRFLPSFTAFDSDCDRHLRNAREDWLRTYTHLDTFTISAFCFVDEEKGLVLGTREEHHGGSKLQFIHVPTNPSLRRLSPPTGDRLALAIPTFNLLKNAKANYSSHTYQLLKACGNYSGISSVRLTSKRQWTHTSELLVKAESQCSLYRQDIQYFLKNLVATSEITENMRSDIFKQQPDFEESQQSLKSSSSLSLSASIKLGDILGVNDDEFLITKLKSVAFAENVDDFGSAPAKLVAPFSVELWILQTMFCVSPYLCEKLSDACYEKPDLLPVVRFLDCLIFRKAKSYGNGKKNRNEVMEVLNKYEASCGSSHVLGSFVAENCGTVKHCPISERKNVIKSLNSAICADTHKVAIFTYSGCNTLRTKCDLPQEIIAHGQKFELRYVAVEQGNQKNAALSKHSGSFRKFWLNQGKKKYWTRTTLKADLLCDRIVNGYWNIAIYYAVSLENVEKLKIRHYQNLTGQGKFICEDHLIPLTRDLKKSGYFCQCGNVSYIRCPIEGCNSCLCRKEAVNVSESTVHVPNDRKTRENVPSTSSQGTDVTSSERSQISSTNKSSQDNFVVDGGLMDERSENSVSLADCVTAAGATPLYVKDTLQTDTQFDLPLHILLNGQCGLLKRKKGTPIYVAAKFKRVLENIATTSPPNSVPLIQSEAMLFPSIFWKQNEDGGYAGAIPAGLYNDTWHNSTLGFVGLDDMLKTRLKDSSLLTSSDPRYIQYAFDCIFNLQLRESDTRVVLSRGWSENAMRHKNIQVVREGGIFFDQDDSRKNVNELSAALRESPATFFFTYTCSQSTHPGVREIFAAINKKYPVGNCDSEERQAAIQAEMINMLRAWERSSRLIMTYIEKSHEEPLGKVLKIWYRYEFQDKTSAFPHIHALIWTENDSFSLEVKSKICCSVSSFLGNLLKEVGSSKYSMEDQAELQTLFEKLQSHSCTKAKFRCHKKTDNLKESTCRVPKYPASLDYSYKHVDKKFSYETLILFQKLGLASVEKCSGKIKVIDELCGGKHHYPTDLGYHISPTNASIFALVRSSTNLQICDRWMSSRYLSKYAAGVEERSAVSLKSSSVADTVGFEINEQLNEKIAGVQLTNRKTEKNRRKQYVARVLSVTESVWWMLQFPYVVTNINFVHVVTSPKEKRAGVVFEPKMKEKRSGEQMYGKQIKLRISLNLPDHRRFTANQELIIVDSERSMLSADKITVFGARPPELLFVTEVEKYFTWFIRSRVTKNVDSAKMLEKNVQKSLWIDGFGYQIKLNYLYRKSFTTFCESFCSPKSQLVRQCVEALQCINSYHSSNFVAHNECQSPVQVVLSNVVPSNSSIFLTHILLSLGEYITEIDIFSQPSIQHAFAAANLIQSSRGATEKELLHLCRRYIMEQLRFYPGSSTILERFSHSALQCLQQATQHNTLSVFGALPQTLQENIIQNAETEVEKLLFRRKENLISCLYNSRITNLPGAADLMRATLMDPCLWKPVISADGRASAKSVHAQQKILDEICDQLESYCCTQDRFFKHHVIIGPPGTGKSYVMIHCIVAALSKGLNCIVTSLAAERASCFGGLHINAIVPFPVMHTPNVSNFVSVALKMLSRDPVRWQTLEKIDVIFVEEVSMICAELWTSVDCVLQFICNRSVPFGGKMVICSGDFLQLPPPSGTFLLLSNSVLTNFTFHHLKEFVRMGNIEGQRLLTLFAHFPLVQADEDSIIEIMRNNCRFVNCWADVPNEMLRVFATRIAEKEAIDQRISIVEQDIIRFCYFEAYDEMSNSGSQNWVRCNSRVSRFLNTVCLEPSKLFIYKLCCLRFTSNLPNLNVYQGQLCFVDDFDEREKTIKVKLAPPGFRNFSVNNASTNTWRTITVRYQPGVIYQYNPSTASRRHQFPLKMFVAATVHKVMGDTIPSLATQLVGGKKFNFWAKEQLYVLISRVQQLSDVMFVGDKDATLNALRIVLQKENHLTPFIHQITNTMTQPNAYVSTSQLVYPFPRKLYDVPTSSSGFTYLLMSIKLPHLFYIGKTMNMRRRLQEHNSGHGSDFTRPMERRPWTLTAFVFGFCNKTLDTVSTFEKDWQEAMILLNRDVTNLEFKHYIYQCEMLIRQYMDYGVEVHLRCECLMKLSKES